MKNIDIAFNRFIWAKIKYYQVTLNISEQTLMSQLGVCQKTLHDYEKSAVNLNLAKIEKFLAENEITTAEFLGNA